MMQTRLIGVAFMAVFAATQALAQNAASTTPDYAPFEAGSAPAVRLPSTMGVPVTGVQPKPSAPAIPAEKPGMAVPAKPAQMKKPVAPKAPRPAQNPGIAAAAPRYTAGMAIAGKAKVVDGSVLTVGSVAVRLEGADAPGLGQDCKTAAGLPWHCGEAARRALAEVADGERVSCVVAKQSGEGASATCSVRGISDLARYMVERGFAVPNEQGRRRYGAASAAASSSRTGIWTGTFEAPWTWRIRNQ